MILTRSTYGEQEAALKSRGKIIHSFGGMMTTRIELSPRSNGGKPYLLSARTDHTISSTQKQRAIQSHERSVVVKASKQIRVLTN